MTTRRSLFSVFAGMAALPFVRDKPAVAKTTPVIGTFDGARFVPWPTEKWYVVRDSTIEEIRKLNGWHQPSVTAPLSLPSRDTNGA